MSHAEPGPRPGPGPAAAPAPDVPADTDPRSAAMMLCGLLGVVLFAAAALLPVPYVIESPGAAIDTLGAVGRQQLISIEGAPTYPTEGSLALTTVAVLGGPGHDVDLVDVVRGWFDDTAAVVPQEQVFAPDQSRDDVDAQSSQEMVSSQENATVAALGELGIDIPTTLVIAGFTPGSDAAAGLREGDVIAALDADPVVGLPELRSMLQATAAGDPVVVRVVREGAPLDVTVSTVTGPDGETLLGVLVDPAFDFPFDVTIGIEDVGGPSAGMMFALGIIDLLTPGPMTGGADVAGTGTISVDGEVGPIGGIAQKMIGARDSGSRWFLAPASNCDEVVGRVPDGLTVVPVADLAQARAAVEAIGTGQAAGLAACPGPVR